MHSKLLVSAAAGALLALTGAAFAQSAVVATTDLNVRAGPGPQHQVVGVIGAGQSATLNGCLENSKWCVVAFNGGDGWVYSDYLTGDFGGTQVVLTERPADSGVRIVTPPADVDGGATGAVTGGVTGAVAGAIIGGPVGAVVGGGAGASPAERPARSSIRRRRCAPTSRPTRSIRSISTAKSSSAPACPRRSSSGRSPTTSTATSM